MNKKKKLFNHIGPRKDIEDLMKSYNINMKDLAIMMGISEANLYDIMKGKTEISIKVAIRLATAFNFALDYFLKKEMDYLASSKDMPSELKLIGARSSLYLTYPIAELARRKWINLKDNSSPEEIKSELESIIGHPINYEQNEFNENVQLEKRTLLWTAMMRRLVINLKLPTYQSESINQILYFIGKYRRPSEIESLLNQLNYAGIGIGVLPNLSKVDYWGSISWTSSGNPILVYTLERTEIHKFLDFVNGSLQFLYGLAKNETIRVNNVYDDMYEFSFDLIHNGELTSGINYHDLKAINNDWQNSTVMIKSKYHSNHSPNRYRKGAIARGSFFPRDYYLEEMLSE